MSNQKPCDVHEERMKTLFKRGDSIEKRVEKLECDSDITYKLDKSIAIQSELVKQIKEHNVKQDKRMEKQDERMEEQQKVIVKVNDNLTALTEGQNSLNKKVHKLEEKVDANEEVHKIDIRKIEKKKWTDIIIKVAIPISCGLGFVAYLIMK